MENLETVKFIFGEEAAIVNTLNKNYIVLSDLHIGYDLKLIEKGVKIYDSTNFMADRIINLTKKFNIKDIIILGDIKESLLYPSKKEKIEIDKFFYKLKDYNITIVSGNHDAHLEELINSKIVDELVIDKIAFLHGHKLPSAEAMLSDLILAGHNHASIEFIDENNGVYTQKIWIIAKLNKDKTKNLYNKFNKSLTLILFPAFNNFITGTPINRPTYRHIFVGDIFNYRTAKLYSINGEYLGNPIKPKSKLTKDKFNL
ncbi:MAG: metallophosphoesterase family protein [Candidatus Micrarchaeia archaeon]